MTSIALLGAGRIGSTISGDDYHLRVVLTKRRLVKNSRECPTRRATRKFEAVGVSAPSRSPPGRSPTAPCTSDELLPAYIRFAHRSESAPRGPSQRSDGAACSKQSSTYQASLDLLYAVSAASPVSGSTLRSRRWTWLEFAVPACDRHLIGAPLLVQVRRSYASA